MLAETLDKLLATVLTLIGAIIGLYVVVRFIRKRSQPLPVEITNHIVLLFFLMWFVLYAIATNMELDAMKKVFDPKVLPGLSVSYGLLALGFSICFSLLIIAHRNLFLVFPIVMVLGYLDLYGNLTLMTGMQYIVAQHQNTGTEPSEPARIWIGYYLANDHLIRIAIYMLITYGGFMLFLAGWIGANTSATESTEDRDLVRRAVGHFKKHYVLLEVIGKLLFVAALVVNEATIWTWRYDREQEFITSGNQKASGYVGWSISSFYKFQPKKGAPSDN